jgi:hypothetical protein
VELDWVQAPVVPPSAVDPAEPEPEHRAGLGEILPVAPAEAVSEPRTRAGRPEVRLAGTPTR